MLNHVQDVVPKAPKFFIMYKRAGLRVIINHNGDMIVRPSAIEASVQVAGARWVLHVQACWMMSYAQSIAPAAADILAHHLEAESSAALQDTYRESNQVLSFS